MGAFWRGRSDEAATLWNFRIVQCTGFDMVRQFHTILKLRIIHQDHQAMNPGQYHENCDTEN